MKLDEHLGRRKPDAASALLRGAERLAALQAIATQARERLEAAARKWPVFPKGASDYLILAEPHSRAVGEALALTSGTSSGPDAPAPRARIARLRFCDRKHPESLRAALGALDPATEILYAPEWEAIARALPYRSWRMMEADSRPQLSSPRALLHGHLLGADVPAQLAAAIAFAKQAEQDGLEGPALRLGALLAGLAEKGASTLALFAPPELTALVSCLHTYAAGMQGEEPLVQLVEGTHLPEPHAAPADRLILALRQEGQQPDARLRKLIAAGVPVLQLESSGEMGAVLALFEIALACAQRGPASTSTTAQAREATSTSTTADGAPSTESVLGTPALSQDSLSLFATPSHAYILSRVASTLGKAATSSVPHWLAAQLALAEPGDVLAFHLCVPQGSQREAAVATLRDTLATGVSLVAQGIRISPGLRDLALGRAQSASARVLHFIISDGGGQELRVGGESLLERARYEEARAFSELANSGSRVVLLRSDSSDLSSLYSALTQAADLLHG